jgi:hypothetical protein
MIDFLKEYWIILIPGLMALIKIIVNLTPTQNDNNIFEWLDKLINAIIPNLKAGGGRFKK